LIYFENELFEIVYTFERDHSA